MGSCFVFEVWVTLVVLVSLSRSFDSYIRVDFLCYASTIVDWV